MTNVKYYLSWAGLFEDFESLFNANPGLNVNLRFNFYRMKMFFTASVLRTLRLLDRLRAEGPTI